MQFPFKLSSEKEFDAAGFGVNAVDHLLVVPEYPNSDTDTRLIEYKQGAGGQTASAIAALQRLGMRTTYAGRFGHGAEVISAQRSGGFRSKMQRTGSVCLHLSKLRSRH